VDSAEDALDRRITPVGGRKNPGLKKSIAEIHRSTKGRTVKKSGFNAAWR
jgi:hypothetical protein